MSVRGGGPPPSRRAAGGAALFALALAAPGGANAAGYGLEPEEVAPGVYVMWGAQEEVSPENGANIANIGFVVGDDGVLAVDTGPTRRYAEEMLAAIARIAGLPPVAAVVTHHHFDHAFGLAAFRDAGVPVVMHRDAAPWLAREGAEVLENVTALAGADWTADTEIAAPDRLIDSDLEIDLGGRVVDVLATRRGHTAGDLTVRDRRTGALFAGDLVFHGRAPSLPHGDATVWRAQLAELAAGGWKLLIPGHGPPVADRAPLDRLADYLGFVRDSTACAWRRGDSRAEALLVEIPAPHDELALVEREFQRSVFQLWRKYDAEGAPPCP